jgi:hypothetical protein
MATEKGTIVRIDQAKNRIELQSNDRPSRLVQYPKK